MPAEQTYSTNRHWALVRKALSSTDTWDWYDEYTAFVNEIDADVQAILDSVTDVDNFQGIPISVPTGGSSDVGKFYKLIDNFNRVLWSEDISQSSVWNYSGTDTISGTDGYVASSTDSSHTLNQSIVGATIGDVYVFEAEIKAGAIDFVLIESYLKGSYYGGSVFDANNGTSTPAVDCENSAITDIGNGWYLAQVELTAENEDATTYLRLQDAVDGTAFAGDGSTVSMYIRKVAIKPGTIAQNAPYIKNEATYNTEQAFVLEPESGNATSIQNIPVSATPPTDGQVVAYNATTEEYEPSSAGTGTDATSIQNIPVLDTMPADLAGENNQLINKNYDNHLLQSEDVNTTWARTRLTAGASDELISNTATGAHYISQAYTTLSAGYVEVEIEAKRATERWIQIAHSTAVTATCNVDLLKGLFGTMVHTTNESIIPLEDGWFSIKFHAPVNGSTATSLFVFASQGDGATSFAGDDTVSTYVRKMRVGKVGYNYVTTTTGVNSGVQKYTPELKGGAKSIACLGDSITIGGYPQYLRGLLPDSTVYDYGISGLKAYQLVNYETLTAIGQYRWIFRDNFYPWTDSTSVASIVSERLRLTKDATGYLKLSCLKTGEVVRISGNYESDGTSYLTVSTSGSGDILVTTEDGDFSVEYTPVADLEEIRILANSGTNGVNYIDVRDFNIDLVDKSDIATEGVIILAGINDILSSETSADIIEALQWNHSQVQQAGLPSYGVQVLQTSQLSTDAARLKRTEINNALPGFCKYIPTDLMGSGTALRAEFDSGDHLHPSPLGDFKLAELMFQYTQSGQLTTTDTPESGLYQNVATGVYETPVTGSEYYDGWVGAKRAYRRLFTGTMPGTLSTNLLTLTGAKHLTVEGYIQSSNFPTTTTTHLNVYENGTFNSRVYIADGYVFRVAVGSGYTDGDYYLWWKYIKD